MNNIRRVVTGHSKEGKAIITNDTTIDGVNIGTGKDFIQLWGDDSTPIHPDSGQMQNLTSWFPPTGGHRFFIWTVPPQTQKNENPVSPEEMEERLPGFLQHFEPDNPGFHTTDSVDCTYVISGSIILELDDEVQTELHAGDSIVQNGTRHRWFNKGDIPAVLVTTCIGSERKG